MTAIDLDRQRRRWGEARRLDRLDLEDTDGFAKGGLGEHVEALDLRIRFLPADPLATLVRLDSEAEEWLSKSRPSPYGGGEPELGRSKRATSSALVRYDRYRDDQGWARFVGYTETEASTSVKEARLRSTETHDSFGFDL